MKLSIDKPKSGYEKVENVELASWDALVKMQEKHLAMLDQNIQNKHKHK